MLRYNDKFRALAFGFAFLAGFVDAIGFLMSGGLFVSFMSGNSTRLAIGLVDVSIWAFHAVGLIGLFVIGVVMNVLVSARFAVLHRKVTAAAGVALLLLVSACFQTFGLPTVTIWFLCVAMGAANAVFQRDGDVTIGVTYMTGTLVRLGYRIAYALLGQNRASWIPFMLIWLAFVSGGITGATGFTISLTTSLWAAVVFATALVFTAHWLTKRSTA